MNASATPTQVGRQPPPAGCRCAGMSCDLRQQRIRVTLFRSAGIVLASLPFRAYSPPACLRAYVPAYLLTCLPAFSTCRVAWLSSTYSQDDRSYLHPRRSLRCTFDARLVTYRVCLSLFPETRAGSSHRDIRTARNFRYATPGASKSLRLS